MSDSTATPSQEKSCEHAAAFLILRLFLGLRTFLAGVEKFEKSGSYSFKNYYDNMGHMAQGITGASFLPLWSTRLFAHSIGYLLLVLGALILLGIKPRMTLLFTGLVYVGLSFGLMAVEENEGIAWLGIHIGLIAAALVLVRHARFSLWPDASR
jgi:thiosulfate dehydrogenase [quinone] large subunit